MQLLHTCVAGGALTYAQALLVSTQLLQRCVMGGALTYAQALLVSTQLLQTCVMGGALTCAQAAAEWHQICHHPAGQTALQLLHQQTCWPAGLG